MSTELHPRNEKCQVNCSLLFISRIITYESEAALMENSAIS